MDGGDGWRLKACSSSVKDKMINNRIMLRFRPIAPKPVTGGSSSSNWKPESKNGLINKERKKRKYVRVKKKNSKEQYQQTRQKKVIPIISSDQERITEDHGLKLALELNRDEKTTDLIPEKRSLSNDVVSLSVPVVQHEIDKDLLFDINNQLIDEMGGLRMSYPMTGKRIVETRVTVESVTDTCMDMVLQLGSTDEEKMRNLEKDTSPGFISDGLNRVVWVNDAYKKMAMVRQEDEGQSPEVSVDLVIKEEFLVYLYGSAFTCWVRLQYTCSQSQMVPCDARKMEFGRFAWRLDVKAALSLGLN